MDLVAITGRSTALGTRRERANILRSNRGTLGHQEGHLRD
jgi:hypothetical protein